MTSCVPNFLAKRYQAWCYLLRGPSIIQDGYDKVNIVLQTMLASCTHCDSRMANLTRSSHQTVDISS